MSCGQVQGDVVSVVYLEFSKKMFFCLESEEESMFLMVFPGLTYSSHGLQSSGVNLVHVVDLWGGVVVLSISNNIDQVVVSEVRDDVPQVSEGSTDKNIVKL